VCCEIGSSNGAVARSKGHLICKLTFSWAVRTTLLGSVLCAIGAGLFWYTMSKPLLKADALNNQLTIFGCIIAATQHWLQRANSGHKVRQRLLQHMVENLGYR
jgi:hypothetical protein